MGALFRSAGLFVAPASVPVLFLRVKIRVRKIPEESPSLGLFDWPSVQVDDMPRGAAQGAVKIEFPEISRRGLAIARQSVAVAALALRRRPLA